MSNRKVRVVLISVVLIAIFFLTSTVLTKKVTAKTLYVGGVGSGNYTTIQSAIDNASSGDTIYVYNGTYYANLIVNKTLSLIGEDRNTTIVDGGGIGMVVNVTAYWVNITNFTVTGGGAGRFDAGIELYSVQQCHVANNMLWNNSNGILLDSSSNNTLTGNNISKNTNGISSIHSHHNSFILNDISVNDWIGLYLNHSDYNRIEINNISFNSWYGIWFDFSDENRIVDCDISSNYDGIRFWGSWNNTVSKNKVLHNGGVGLGLTLSSGNTFLENLIQNGNLGIYANDSSDDNDFRKNTISWNEYAGIVLQYICNNNRIVGNNISSNSQYGLVLLSSSNNRVYWNDFISNSIQALDDRTDNIWDNGYPSGGNYWSDYTGIDNCSGPNQDVCPDPDGIGDDPYEIDADSRDRYPLTSPCLRISPRPPEVLQATLSGRNLENVTLTWSLSPDDGSGFKSVVGYEIHRNMTYNLEGLSYELIASLPNGTSTFVDNYSGEGDLNNYFYRVCALDVDNNTACAKSQAGKFTRPLLTEGVNLASIPLIQSDESIDKVLQTMRFDKAWTYDSSSKKWEWYMTFKPYGGGLRSMNETKGFWVNVTKDCNFTVAGIVPYNTIIHLRRGWNIVSFPSFERNYTAADLKLDVNATMVEGFDSSSEPYFLKMIEDTEKLGAGFAYWVEVPEDILWTVSN